MHRLITHAVVFALVVTLSLGLGLGPVVMVVGLAAGIVVAHLVSNRHAAKIASVRKPIGDSDPLMLQALKEAEQTWPQFLALREQYPNNSALKFRLETSEGVENVWAKLLTLGDEHLRVQLLTQPVGTVSTESPNVMEISRSDVIDWQVLLDDDGLLGGFTQRAVFRILLRDGKDLPELLSTELARYRDLPDSGHGER